MLCTYAVKFALLAYFVVKIEKILPEKGNGGISHMVNCTVRVLALGP